MTKRGTGMRFSILFALCVCLAGSRAHAQDQQGETPKPPAKAYGPLGVDDQQQENQTPDTFQPDTRPITGFQQPTVRASTQSSAYLPATTRLSPNGMAPQATIFSRPPRGHLMA